MIDWDEARASAPLVVESNGFEVELSPVGGSVTESAWGPDSLAVRALEDGRPMGFVDRTAGSFAAFVFPSSDAVTCATFAEAVDVVVDAATPDA